MKSIQHFNQIADYHQFAQLPPPLHPLISLIPYQSIQYPTSSSPIRWKQGYYTIGLKRNIPFKFYYGQQEYDFNEGIMTFIAPNQVMSMENNPNIQSDQATGFLLLIHPEFLWKSELSMDIQRYEYFGYEVREALFLAPNEEERMLDLLKNIEREYQSNMDRFSQKIILAQIVLLLNYAERFYARQFITRQSTHHQVEIQLEKLLSAYFNRSDLLEKGIPSVQWVAEQLHYSPNYLSGLLKATTGQSTQQHIHQKLIEKAKNHLAENQLSISEIAYLLGFDYPASFTKLFKNKTNESPADFRKRMN